MTPDKTPDEIRKQIQKLRLAYRRARYTQEKQKRKERAHKLCQVSAFLFRDDQDLDRAYTSAKDNDVRAFVELTEHLAKLLKGEGNDGRPRAV